MRPLSSHLARAVALMARLARLMSGLMSTLAPSLAGALLLVLIGTNEARATHGELTGFRLSSCGESSCLTIQAEQALAGRIPFTFAFADAVITIEDRQTNKRIQFKSNDAYFDSISDKLFMRQVSGLDSKNVEAMYDLKSGELKLFTIRTRP